jgi:hypothetical protein
LLNSSFKDSEYLKLNYFPRLNNCNTDAGSGGSLPSSGQELVSYNPSLFELTEDDSHFFDDTSNMFLDVDNELQSMLTTDRDKLKQSNVSDDQQVSTNSLFIPMVQTSQQTSSGNIGGALSTPVVHPSSPFIIVSQPQTTSTHTPTSMISGAGKRK